MYKFIYDYSLQAINPSNIRRVKDSAIIPFDPANTDYQAYLKWLEEGNQPLPAEENQ